MLNFLFEFQVSNASLLDSDEDTSSEKLIRTSFKKRQSQDKVDIYTLLNINIIQESRKENAKSKKG